MLAASPRWPAPPDPFVQNPNLPGTGRVDEAFPVHFWPGCGTGSRESFPVSWPAGSWRFPVADRLLPSSPPGGKGDRLPAFPGTSFKDRFSMRPEKRRKRWERTASMFRASEGSLRIKSMNSFRAKKKARVSSRASALAGYFLPVNTATSPKGSPGPKIWRVCSLPPADSLKIFTARI